MSHSYNKPKGLWEVLQQLDGTEIFYLNKKCIFGSDVSFQGNLLSGAAPADILNPLTQDIVPDTTNNRNLGNATNQFSEVYSQIIGFNDNHTALVGQINPPNFLAPWVGFAMPETTTGGGDKLISENSTATLTHKTLTNPTINTPTISNPAFSTAVTNSNQPQFYVKLGTGVTNVTGDSTLYTIPFNTVVGTNNGYNTTLGYFTPSTSGLYLFTGAIIMDYVTVNPTEVKFVFDDTGAGSTYAFYDRNSSYGSAGGNGTETINFAFLYPCVSTKNYVLKVSANGGTKNDGVNAGTNWAGALFA